MKKKVFALLAVMALSLTMVMPVSAGMMDPGKQDDVDSSMIRQYTNQVIGQAENCGNASTMKVSGPSNVQASVVYSSDSDNIHENGITPFVRECVKNSLDKDNSSKLYIKDIDAIYYFNLTADEPGQVTFKLDDAFVTPGGYAVVMHYTGNPQDQDCITAQYVKIGSGGRVTANFNSYGPVAIIATSTESAQKMVNSYYIAEGSDQSGMFFATVNGGNSTIIIISGIAVIAAVAGTLVYRKRKNAA